mgnify:CR=1 FL=1
MISIHTLRHTCPIEAGAPPPWAQMFGQVLENNKAVGWGMAIPQGPQIAQYQFAVCPYCKEGLPATLEEWKTGKAVADGEDRTIGYRTPGGERKPPVPWEPTTPYQ